MPVKSVIALEELVSADHTLPLRVFAGVACLCVYGVKRWSDVQHVLTMTAVNGCKDIASGSTPNGLVRLKSNPSIRAGRL